MWKNIFNSAIRNLLRYKMYNFINILGLSVGIASCVLILLFVRFELSYDRFFTHAEQIHRLSLDALSGNTVIRQTYTSAPMPKVLMNTIPEIEEAVRLCQIGGILVQNEEIKFIENKLLAVDSNFFNLFDFRILHGQKEEMLNKPNTVVLTQSTARKYFGDSDPMHKTIEINIDFFSNPTKYEVTGIVEDCPENCHFEFDFLTSLVTYKGFYDTDDFGNNSFQLYLNLKPGISAPVVQNKIQDYFVQMAFGGDTSKYADWKRKGNKWDFILQPLVKIHLTSDLSGELKPTGNLKYVYIFASVAFLILLIACVNFLNLSTARSSLRAKEVATRKVLGANQGMIMRQFLTESVLICILAMVVGMTIVESLLPLFSDFVNSPLRVGYFDSLYLIPTLIGVSVLIGILSGVYPAFYLSRFEVVSVFQKKTMLKSNKSVFRSILIVFQYTIAIALISGTLIIAKQLRFLQDYKLGFCKEQVLIVKNIRYLKGAEKGLKEDILKLAGIKAASLAVGIPGSFAANWGFGADTTLNNFSLNCFFGDVDLAKTLNLEMAMGRFFDASIPTDSSGIVLNETAAKLIGWKDPIDKKVNNWSNNKFYFNVIGVVKDYKYESAHQEIRPMAILYFPSKAYRHQAQYLLVKTETNEMQKIIQEIEKMWNQLGKGPAFEYSFLDKEYDSLYNNEAQTKKIFTLFSFLAIFIACLGLFGLTSFIIDQKTKEICIRKVHGADMLSIFKLVVFEFIPRISIALLIATPLAWYYMNQWLMGFAFRIDVSWWPFVLAGTITAAISILTVVSLVVKATRQNPAWVLKYE